MTNKKYFISKIWSADVKKRDYKKCIICNSNKDLEAHHIFGISQYPYLTTEINNGITLCKKCHNRYHKQYTQINPITWTEFILNENNKPKKIKNKNKTHKKNQKQPLINNNVKETILYEIKTSKCDDMIISDKQLTLRINQKYGIKKKLVLNEIKILLNEGLITSYDEKIKT